MNDSSYLMNADPIYLEQLYKAYKEDPNSIDVGWKRFFEEYDVGNNAPDSLGGSEGSIPSSKEINVLNLIQAYRSRGHLFVTHPIVSQQRKLAVGKELQEFDLSDNDLYTSFDSGKTLGKGKAVALKEIKALLEATYCGHIGVEYQYMDDPEKTKWFEAYLESDRKGLNLSVGQQSHILDKLNQAVVFEDFLQKKFLGQKRFSVEGAEGLIPTLDALIENGASLGVEEFVIGMSHRGRLNVLANILEKPYATIFTEFKGENPNPSDFFGGDVKYHLGYDSDILTQAGKKIHLSLCPNPSHLETVDAIALGVARSKIDNKYARAYQKLVPVLIHGDAAVAGQGIVYEVVQMAELSGYRTGGTIHLVVNNQIGFTTDTQDARSSTYCTDVAKVTLSPVLHVNGDDPEALVYAITLAIEYRQKFYSDIWIDIICYRKYGHNEADEPRFTQPALYKDIDRHANVYELYKKKLVTAGIIQLEDLEKKEKVFREKLENALTESRRKDFKYPASNVEDDWKELRHTKPTDFLQSPDTALSPAKLQSVATQITVLPAEKKFFKKIEKLFKERQDMAKAVKSFDWAMAELLAYASLLDEGFGIRFSGEDVQRGTFSHRHAVLNVEDSKEKYIPICSVAKAGATFEIYNSHLSEYAVLGFEYGYAMASPKILTIWEAQFGDFVNGAQIIIDQYIASAETKWKRSNGLVLLLPHGYEGQGPEHSSARIERMLELCAEDNMYVVNCSTPAQFFHVLRRQLKTDYRKPLIVFTPKSLLRDPLCVSPASEFTTGGFKEVIDDAAADPETVKRLLFCSGKIYYALSKKQEKDKNKEVAIIRLEQMHPLPTQQIEQMIKKYKQATTHKWVQEEPENMGAWPYLCRHYRRSLMEVIARKPSGSPATGYAQQHKSEQDAIIEQAFKFTKQ